MQILVLTVSFLEFLQIEELPAVPDFLHSLGLEKYINSFQREEVSNL